MTRPLEVHLDPEDNQRLARLCGALDANLRGYRLGGAPVVTREHRDLDTEALERFDGRT